MTYIVQPGDTLYKIAHKYNISADFILSTNPQITNPNIIYPGDTIVIPPGEKCPHLHQGDRGPAVSRFQTLLQIARFEPGPIDRIFGPRRKALSWPSKETKKNPI